MTPVFKALAAPTRRRLLDLLRTGPATTGDLAARFDVSRYAVMKHLSILEAAGLVTVQRQGRERWNFLNAMPLQAVHDRWVSAYASHWTRSLASLGRVAEAEKEAEETMEPTAEKPPIVDLNTLNLRLEAHVAAPPEAVYAALTTETGKWWGAPYLRDEDRATDMVLEAFPGGHLREVWGDDEGVAWGEVTQIRAPRVLELTGRMGMTGPVYAVVTFALTAAEGGTVVTLTHQAVGDVDAETESGYREGWTDLVEGRLKAFVETGRTAGVRGAS